MKSCIPSEVKIGGMVFLVEEVDELATEDGGAIFGEVSVSKLRIRINKGMAGAYKPSTLWHEIMHALLYMTGHEEDNNEGLVQALGQAIVMLIRENPVLVQYTRDSVLDD